MPKVLIIEDILDSANLAKKILTKFDHEVLHADSGAGGLRLAVEGQPDLVLLDLGLPDIDGQTLVGMLRREVHMESTPIILCTAWPEAAAQKMAEAYGFDGYISKPYKVTHFMEIINRYLNNSSN